MLPDLAIRPLPGCGGVGNFLACKLADGASSPAISSSSLDRRPKTSPGSASPRARRLVMRSFAIDGSDSSGTVTDTSGLPLTAELRSLPSPDPDAKSPHVTRLTPSSAPLSDDGTNGDAPDGPRADVDAAVPGKKADGKRPGIFARLLLFLLTVYKRLISPMLPPACRFYPTCSEYAMEAVRRHGAIRGGAYAARRLCRCHPWNPGGHDPVPQPVKR